MEEMTEWLLNSSFSSLIIDENKTFPSRKTACGACAVEIFFKSDVG